MSSGESVIVLLSGGLDSATVLAMMRERGWRLYGLSFDYGQRHRAELDAVANLARVFDLAERRVFPIALDAFGGSALTDDSIAVPETPANDIPVTYVPARNTVFLSIALAWAEVLDAGRIAIGVNALDYSGYRIAVPEYIAAFQAMARLATKDGVEAGGVTLETPLIDMKKSEIIRAGTELGVDYSLTVSCYQPDDDGRACGRCDACRLRRTGFAEAGIPDPTRYVSPA